MFERGLAYRRRSSVNWCPKDHTVLANEQVIDGKCWRCGSDVETRDLEQWFFRITAYADELLDATAALTGWPEKVLTMQRNWIGRSEGARVKFAVEGDPDTQIEVFTTRIDTIYGATFVLLGPEHPLVAAFADRSSDPAGFKQQAQAFRLQDRAARVSGDIEKQGFDTGVRAINPFTGQPVPIWVANFVLGEYGTGAIMAVPAHDQRDFEFARKFKLPIAVVITPDGKPASSAAMTEAHQRTASWSTRRVLGTLVRGRAEAHDRRGDVARHRRRHGAVPAEGLGHFPPALLGHADPDDLLPHGRHRAGPDDQLPVSCRRSRSSPAAAIRRSRRCPSSST
jgi:leucyl-tRNA synthetase